MLLLRPWLSATHIVEQSRKLGQKRIYPLCFGQGPDMLPNSIGVEPAMGWATICLKSLPYPRFNGCNGSRFTH
jgi:hypothetical protein